MRSFENQEHDVVSTIVAGSCRMKSFITEFFVKNYNIFVSGKFPLSFSDGNVAFSFTILELTGIIDPGALLFCVLSL